MIKFYLLLLVVFLSGCTTIPAGIHSDEGQLSRLVYLEQEVSKLKHTKKCNLFILPVLERVTNIDIETYQKIPQNDKEARLAFLVRYIETLRVYISDSKAVLRENYITYLKECIS